MFPAKLDSLLNPWRRLCASVESISNTAISVSVRAAMALSLLISITGSLLISGAAENFCTCSSSVANCPSFWFGCPRCFLSSFCFLSSLWSRSDCFRRWCLVGCHERDTFSTVSILFSPEPIFEVLLSILYATVSIFPVSLSSSLVKLSTTSFTTSFAFSYSAVPCELTCNIVLRLQ